MIKTFGMYLTEMSFEAKFVKIKIMELQDNITEHLIYMYLGKLAKSRDYDHWKQEVYTWLNKINNYYIKGNKKLSAQTYYDYLFDGPLNNGIENWYYRIKQSKEDKNINIDLSLLKQQEMFTNLSNFMKEISKLLEMKNVFNKQKFNDLSVIYLK